MSRLGIALLMLAAMASAAESPLHVVGLPCEDCGAALEYPAGELQSRVRLGPKDAPGEPMQLDGVVTDSKGNPVAGVIIYAYHTSTTGRYPKRDWKGNRTRHPHGLFRGWAITDAEGRYHFDSIRPGAYAFGRAPQHVHMHVVEPGRCTYYIDDVMFTDDPRLARELKRRTPPGRGGPGIVEPWRQAFVWHVTRNIELGRNVPGYEACD